MSDRTDQQDFAGKVVVITGASSGMGKGAAREFARRGAALVLAARRGELLDDLAAECATLGGKAISLETDVSLPDDVARLAQAAHQTFGRIDVWINGAGVGAIGRFDEVPLEDHVQIVNTNLLGTIYGSHHALQVFRRQGQGVLINIASALGKIAAPYYASYTATKSAIVGLDTSIRQELSASDERNIRVCTLMPMATDTPFFEHAANYTGRESVPIPPVYDAKRVIDVLVELAINPEDEVIIGTMGKLSNAAHHLMPGAVEKYMEQQTHKAQIVDAPPAPPTPGSLHAPEETGTGVSGGWKSDTKKR